MAGNIDTQHGILNPGPPRPSQQLPFPGLPLHGGFGPIGGNVDGRPTDQVQPTIPGQATQGVKTDPF
jgi:hypothetical protein